MNDLAASLYGSSEPAPAVPATPTVPAAPAATQPAQSFADALFGVKPNAPYGSPYRTIQNDDVHSFTRELAYGGHVDRQAAADLEDQLSVEAERLPNGDGSLVRSVLRDSRTRVTSMLDGDVRGMRADLDRALSAAFGPAGVRTAYRDAESYLRQQAPVLFSMVTGTKAGLSPEFIVELARAARRAG